MRASSTASLTSALVALNQELGANVDPDQGVNIAEEFFALAAMTEESGRLARCLTDPARATGDKQALVSQIFGEKVSPATASALGQLVAGRWSAEGDFAQACHLIATHLLLRSAHSSGQLEQVERDVFAVEQLLKKQRDLRGALAENTGQNPQARVELLSGLLANQVNPISLRLIQDAVRTSKAGRLQSSLRGIGDAAAAMRSQAMATVVSSIELLHEQVERIRAVLSKRTGQDMVINTVVDPQLVGGIRIRYAHSVLDGSIANLLKETRRQLAS